MASPPNPYPRLERSLRRLRRRWLLVEGGAAAAVAGAVLLLAALAWATAEALLYLPPGLRLLAGPTALAAAGAAAARRLGRRLGRRLDLHRVARLAEERCPALRARLLAAWELHPVRHRRHVSGPLLDAAAAAAADLLERTGRAGLVPLAPLRRPALSLAGAAAAALLAAFVSPEAMPAAVDRCLHPTTRYERPRRTHLAVRPGDMEVVRGDQPAIEVRLTGAVPPTARIRRRLAADADAPAPWVSDEVLVGGTSATGGAGAVDTLRYSFGPARQSFVYQVVAGDAASPVHRVRVIEPPAVRRLRLTLEYPEYSGLAPRVEAEGGDVRALAGTRIGLEVWANKSLSAAAVVFESGDSVRSRLPAAVRDNQARAAWRLAAGDGGLYHLELRDVAGIGNREPIRYAVQVLADGPPSVAITDPGRDADLPENQRVTVAVEASDDFGISEMSLVFRVNDGPERAVPLEAETGREVRQAHLWDLTDLDLLPEDRVYYRAEVADNDAVTGPKRASSAEYAFRFPSLYELYDEVSQAQEEHLEALEELARDEDEARQYVEQLRREVLRSEALTWEQKKELEATLEAEEERVSSLDDVAEQVADTVEKLRQQGLSSTELVQKLEEIRQLMAAVTSPELQEALAELESQLEELSPEDIAAALEEFGRNQEAFQERLDRTLALLRQVHAEQRLEAAVRQAADLRDRQSRIGEALRRAGDRPGDLARLEDQEGSLERDTRRLQSELGDLARDLAPLSQPVGEGLEEVAGHMEQNRLSGRMAEMRQALRARQRQAARRTGAGLEEDLGRLAADLDRLQGEFTAGQKAELAAALRRAMADLLHLSHRQEDLARRTAARPPEPAALAAEQYALYQGTGSVVADVARLGERTLTLSLGLSATLGRALEAMERAATQLGQRSAIGAGPRQVSATGYLNEAVALLRASASNLEEAGSPSGFAEAMQKMMGLSEQQAALNQATQQAMGAGSEVGRQGRGREDLRQQMARLAAQQRRIYRALTELERTVRGHRGMEKRLEAIRRDMESALRHMEQSRPRPELARTQERILQRMLDASRSIHSRGFERRRRSQTGADLAYEGPNWLPLDLGQAPDRLRDALRDALASDYPRPYRQLIQRYFELMYGDLGPRAAPLADEGEVLP